MRVLVVAYYFPPKGGAGTQRFAKFCKYLPEHGVDPVVLSAGAGLQNENAPHDDPTLLVDTRVPVERVEDPQRVPLGQRLVRALRFHLDEDEWARAAGERAVEIVGRQPPDAVVTTLSPYACYRIGERLRQQFGLPWLLDLRDPWALDGWRRYRSGLHARNDLRQMQRALRSADCVIANVPEAAAAYVELGADPERTVVVPNGYDDEDFAREQPVVLPRDGRFQIVHMGTLHAVDAEPGLTRNTPLLRRHRQIEPLGRTGYYLLHALSLLRQRSPAIYGKIAVHLYGNVDASHRAIVDRLGVGDALALHGYVPHRESIAALCGADAVFVPLHGVPADERALVVPGKLYEALASERAVLAALPPGDGADLVRHLRAGLVVAPTDAPALAAAIEAMVERHGQGQPLGGCRRSDLLPFTRRRLTARFAEILRAVVAGRTAIAVADPWQELGVART
jgi:glycosyltransferase involved in cell wall biosynthesis